MTGKRMSRFGHSQENNSSGKPSGLVFCFAVAGIVSLTGACTQTPAPPASTANDGKKDSGKDPEDMTKILVAVPRASIEKAVEKYMPAKLKRRGDVSARAFNIASRVAFNKNDYENSVVLADRAIMKEADDGEAYYRKGKALASAVAGSDSSALENLQKAIKLGYEDADVYFQIYRLYDGQKEYKEALKALNKAIELAPERDYYKNRAALYADLGDKDKARADYDRAVERSPLHPAPFVRRADFLESTGSSEEALTDYQKVLELESRKHHRYRKLAFKSRAEIFMQIKKPASAVKSLSLLLEEDPADDEAVRMRGQAYAQLKKYDEAIKDFSKAVSMAPTLATAYEERSRVYDLMGKKDLAQKDREKAEQLKEKPAVQTL